MKLKSSFLKIINYFEYDYIFSDKNIEDPIKSEIFSTERLKQHAQSLALSQTITSNPKKGFNLSKRLKNNRKILFNSYQIIGKAINNKQTVTPAAEWLIDNYHIIEGQLKDISEHLPIKFYKELPKLSSGYLKNYPRVYGLSWAFIAHTDSRFDPELLTQFVRTYQQTQPLTIGELWAIAITLRIVLVENLRRHSILILSSMQTKKSADLLADELLGLGTSNILETIETYLKSFENKQLKKTFLVHLIQRLRYHDPSITSTMNWLHEKLDQINLSADELVSLEHNKQSAANVTVRNIITSMRLISAFDWQTFFESISLVNDILNTNPTFALMDFTSQDKYRHAIEELSKGSRFSEIDIAKHITHKIERYKKENFDKKKLDLGYYLISTGRKNIEKEIKFSPPIKDRFLEFFISNSKVGYIGTIIVSSIILLLIPIYQSYVNGVSLLGLFFLSICGIFPASDISISLLNIIVTKVIKPSYLPRLKLVNGIPPPMQTCVVMPILLTNKKAIKEHLEQLEVHYLSNSHGSVYFALLSDWKDSQTEHSPEDTELFQIAEKGIEQLNFTYNLSKNEQKRFFLFHRKRIWNQKENTWMGWERKRGKLHEFNKLLRGAKNTTYLQTNNKTLENTKYIVTLDADTRISIGTINQLVGTMEHPLNQPTFDTKLQRIIDGYGIMQPRIMSSLPSRTNNSIFQKLFSGPCGIDPYTFAVSDVYQDLFKEGTYAGKGIYNIDIFEASLKDRVPENTLLSHDLFEGIFARCGFISNLEFFDDFPSNTEVSSSRTDRWTRGDWQLLPWLFGKRSKEIPFIGRWKIFDNLRRSLSSPAMLFTLIGSWFIPYTPQPLWTIFILLSLAFPLYLPFISGLFSNTKKRKYDFLTASQQTIVLLSLLMHQGILMLSSIILSLYRLFISKRNLLNWTTIAQEQLNSNLTISYFYKKHFSSLCFSIILGLEFLFARCTHVKLLAGFFILLWILSPIISRYISQPPLNDPTEPISEDGIKSFRLIARHTWRFFTTFITEETNFLPPDNFQEDPNPVLAQRSSPTNFGLYLLSIISANDFGWIGIKEMINKLESTFSVLDELPRFKGHFYNWYDLKTKEALLPQYISSVDSGNLAGHLLVTAQTSKEMLNTSSPLLNKINGIQDAIHLFKKSLVKINNKRRTLTVNLDHIQIAIKDIEELLKDFPLTPYEHYHRWESLLISSNILTDITKTFSQEHDESNCSELLFWSFQITLSIKSHLSDYEEMHSWAKFINEENLPPNISSEEKEQIILLFQEEVLKLSLNGLCNYYKKLITNLTSLQKKYPYNNNFSTKKYIDNLISIIEKSLFNTEILVKKLISISNIATKLFDEMDFKFLFDSKRNLFSIGFNVSNDQLDSSYYDMLASEARLTSFIAITKGDAPTKHWFSLNRTLTSVANGSALLSWSGSMFEYLMPSLIMYTPRGSLLDRTCRLIIKEQIEYGEKHEIPWGISESAYNIRDRNFTYQYSGFGIPALGLKRGLEEDLVISPYSTALAAMYYPKLAEKNFQQLEEIGSLGTYGYYESLDFTAERLPENKDVAIVHAYMVHHQGMALISLTNVVFDGIMRHRFHNIPSIRAAELLLQERTPRNVSLISTKTKNIHLNKTKELTQSTVRRFNQPNLHIPSTHLLSNGHYTVMLTSAGSGYSKWNDTSITRWREDPTCDSWGSYIFLYDTENKKSWSAGFQPSGTKPHQYEVTFAEDRAKINRKDDDITSDLEIIVSPEDNAEIRRLTLKNLGTKIKEIEVTSYNEIVLNTQDADVMHPAFSNLFIQTEYISKITSLIATRRPRSSNELPIWMAHVITVEGEQNPCIEYETDRARFIGRNSSIRKPLAIIEGQPLSNTAGAVLNPIASLRTRINLPPGATKNITFSTIVASSREKIIDLADKYHDPSTFHRISTLAWTHAQVQLHYLDIDSIEANSFQELANQIIYPHSTLSPSNEFLKKNTLRVSSLWAHQISGDNPILLVHIDNVDDAGLIKQLLHAHEYWRMKRLTIDLIIINNKATSYIQDLQTLLETMVRTSLQMSGNYTQEICGNIFVLRADLLSSQEKELLQNTARYIMSSKEGGLSEQLKKIKQSPYISTYQPKKIIKNPPKDDLQTEHKSLEFFNGLGGFSDNGREYIITLKDLQFTPAPWINIIANNQFGFFTSESGSGYTWSSNSKENQLTPWSNDPVSDPCSEAFYIYDNETGDLWTPTALPIRLKNATYITRHGQGYTTFEHTSHDIESKLTQFVSWDDPIKISHLILENKSNKIRTLSITAYLEWALGSSKSKNTPFIITELDEKTNSMFISNPWSIEFGHLITFIDFCGKQSSWTGNRTEFIGRNGTLENPVSLLLGEPLSNNVGARLDPCSAQQVQIKIPAKGKVELSFLFGQAQDRKAASDLIKKYRLTDPKSVLKTVKENWENILCKVQVKTPDRKIDLMLNRWLLYQTLACRYWGRTAFYQAGGAYGFRDQLQDVMALVYSQPEITKAHILNSASHQFLEGDVQHWWHPPLDKGVRTKCSDDSIWLPYVVHHYIKVTGDHKILNEVIPFLEGRELLPEEEGAYYQPIHSTQSASLFEHCKRALDRSLKIGVHGLPLIGSCDWNDGMNRVGYKGYGESVWLGWFLYSTLTQFADIAKNKKEIYSAGTWIHHAENLKASLEKEAWDGAWYKRAYFDDGTPLGSTSNAECRIDSITQSWSVISKAGDKNRSLKAMESVEKHLIKPGDNLSLLFSPPFNKTHLDPGYIKGYLPGIRENGSQYTHAAIWNVIALTMLGNGNKAYELFTMLNPISHSDSRAGVHKYKVEPYVIAADIYSEPPHVGRGGWTWYTGSASWMYRAGLESILGLSIENNSLHINPCIPNHWQGFTIYYNHEQTQYEIIIENPSLISHGIKTIELDGKSINPIETGILLTNDKKNHTVIVVLG